MKRLVLILSLACAAPAAAQEFDLSWHSLDAGGGVSAAGDIRLVGVIGQPDAGGVMTAGSYTLVGGFLPAGGAEAICRADCDESGSLDIFDFLCFQNLFTSGDPEADCDESGALDFFDFLCFQNEFSLGCP